MEQDKPAPLILIADDDRTIRAVLKAALERHNFQVISATNGREALDLSFSQRPDLILLDVKMPIMDGFEAVQLMRQEPATARIPVILLTAAARTPGDAAHGLNLGADDYLHKPFGIDELVARVQRKLKDRQMEESLQQRTHELEATIFIGSQLNEVLPVHDLIDRLTRLILTQIPAMGAMMTICDPSQTPSYKREPNGDLLLHNGIPAVMQRIIDSTEPLLVRNLDECRAIGVQNFTVYESMVGVPLIHAGKVLGALALGHSQPNSFNEHTVRILRSIAEQASLALRNAQLYAELQNYANGLEEMIETRTASLLHTQTQLMRAEKMAAIGTLAAGVAHEVNNPLQPLLTNLEMMLEDIDANRPVSREDILHSYAHVERIKGLVRRLLSFARPERQQVREVNLNTIIEEVVSLVSKPLQQAKIALEYALDTMPVLIVGNHDQLAQVILNLVVNARDAMEKDGGRLYLNTFTRNNFGYAVIRDTGVGMSPDTLSKIFDPFYTTKHDGTGLGLALSFQITEAHGGQLQVESEIGSGTQFTLCLPLASE